MKTPFKKLRSAIPRASLAKDRWRFVLLWGVMLAIFAVLLLRAFYLQIIDRKFLQEKADEMILRTDTIQAYRGKITDRHGVPLAVSTPLITLWMDVKEYNQALEERALLQQKLLENPDNKSLKRRLDRQVFDLDQLALAVGIDADELKQKIKSRPNTRFLVLKRQLSPAAAQVVLDRRFQSVHRQVEYRRFYPQAQPNAQLIGLTNSRDQGIEGLELVWNSRLAGQDGKMQVMRDRRGNRIQEVELVEPDVQGEHISLSIDSRLQYIMYRELAAGGITNNARSATAVAVDVNTGEILAMASWPSFNPNDSAAGLTNKDAMRNRAAVDMFEPGSTVKPLTVAAALESGKFHKHSIIETTGSMRIGNSTIRDSRNLGNIDLETLIVKSSNVASAKIAQALPKETMPNFYRRFGFAARTDLRFPGESTGMIMPESRWGVTEIATMSYGYGLGTTAIQLAQAYAVLGAGGMMYPLTLEKRTEPVEGKRILDETIARDVMLMMEGVTKPGGTARRAAITGYRVAGKTGTARKLRSDGKGYSRTEYRALFVGVAPVSNPRIALAVVVENPVGQFYGGLVAAPIFAKVMQESLRLMSVPLDQPLDITPNTRARR